MSESFLVLFNTQGSNVVNNDFTKGIFTFKVDWEAFLPKKYKKFHCQFVFKSVNSSTQLTTNGFVNMNLGKMNVYDGSSQSSNLGIIYPAVCNNQYYYSSTHNDNNDFWISYPSNQIVTITLNQFDNKTAMANIPHYCLYLSLIGIKDEEIQ